MSEFEPRGVDEGEDGPEGRALDPDLDLELDASEGQLSVHLRELLAPEADLGRHTTHHVDSALRARSVLSTGMDLIGLGWLTMRELLTDEPTRADGESEGT